MLDVCLLGTAGMMPLPYRWLTSLMLRYNGSSLLIDCGEGTQIAIKEAGLSFKPIDVLCVTHFHADHISGLPGFLLTMGNAERTEPLTIIGPKGLTRVVNALRTIAPELPFEIQCIELEDETEDIEINVCKKKQMTNPRSSGSDEALRLSPPKILSLEQALEFIDTDELLEVTPKSLRIRKKILDPTMRKRAGFRKS